MLPILRDISQGMRFLHSADPQVIHGDLKAQNILVDGRFRAKVADFGLSQKQKIGGTGTPYWMAPELLRKESANTSASDVFSFGGKWSRIHLLLCFVSQCFIFRDSYSLRSLLSQRPVRRRRSERSVARCHGQEHL